MTYKNKDLIAGCCIFIFALVFYVYSFEVKLTNIDTIVGSRLFPQIITALLMIFSLWLIVGSVLKNKKRAQAVPAGENQEEKDATKHKYTKTILVFVSLGIYIFLLDIAGFMIATALYLFSQMYLLETKEKKGYVKYIIVSIVISVAVYYMFTEMFSLVLPRGRFF